MKKIANLTGGLMYEMRCLFCDLFLLPIDFYLFGSA